MTASNVTPYAVLIHGMGRTPVAMLLLASRLRAAGFRPRLFSYSASFESWQSCVNRLERFMIRKTAGAPFVVIGHSLGSVLARAVLPKLDAPPLACFFLSPPTRACLLARSLAPRTAYQWLNGEMGQLLASPQFMAALPTPSMPTIIYAGTAGPKGRLSPFKQETNDGILTITEMQLPGVPTHAVPALHTFIMNSRTVADDIIRVAQALGASSAGN